MASKFAPNVLAMACTDEADIELFCIPLYFHLLVLPKVVEKLADPHRHSCSLLDPPFATKWIDEFETARPKDQSLSMQTTLARLRHCPCPFPFLWSFWGWLVQQLTFARKVRCVSCCVDRKSNKDNRRQGSAASFVGWRYGHTSILRRK